MEMEIRELLTFGGEDEDDDDDDDDDEDEIRSARRVGEGNGAVFT